MFNLAEDEGWESACASTSASSGVPKSCAVTKNTSGWDDLVEFYHTGASGSADKRKREWIGMDIPIKENIETLKASENKYIVICPICDYHIVSKYSQATIYTLKKYSRHLKIHEGELSNSYKIACSICYNFYSKSKIKEHSRICHRGNSGNCTSGGAFHFTNSVHRYQDIINFEVEDLSLERCSQLPGGTLFTGCSTKRSLEHCRAVWMEKFRSTCDPLFLFMFKITQNSCTPFAWICPLCDHSVAFSESHLFSNDISLRLFMLRHFFIRHKNESSLTTLLSREWEIIDDEIGFNLSYYVQDSVDLLRQVQRSCHFYVLPLSRRDSNTLLYEMVKRNANNEEENSCALVVCALCLNPVRRGFLFRHFSTDGHGYLEVHAEFGEFREVVEIAESYPLTFENFPFAALRFSKTYRIRALGDTQSTTFLKWRCTLSSEVLGHADDVLEFPTVSTLKIHALKHFQTYHNGFFEPNYLEYEWGLLKAEHPSSGEIRTYTPLKWNFDGEPFDTTNPNHFRLPYRSILLSKPFSDIQICGFCFLCGCSSQFLSHITCHGYIDTGIPLERESIELPSEQRPLQEIVYAVIADLEVPREILGPVGRESQMRIGAGKCSSTSSIQADFFIGDPGENTAYSSNSCFGSASSSAVSSDKVESELSSETSSFHELDCMGSSTLLECNDESDTSSLNDLSICHETSPERQEQLRAENSQCVSASTSTSDSVSVTDMTLATSSAIEAEADLTHTNESRSCSVEEHKALIQKKFTWEGPPPPAMNVEQTEQLMMLSRNECPYCTTAHGSRGLRVPAFANDEIREESMIAHIVRFHHDDTRAAWVVNAKRYRLSMGGLVNPLKFHLEPSQEGFLVCSSCDRASFSKLANLRVHWMRCVEVCGRYRKDLRLGKYVLETSSRLAKPPRQRSKNPSVKCPVPECISAWRPSFIYPNVIGQVSHILARHLTSKEAYDLALQLGSSEKLEECFPFLNVAKSFANTLNHPKTMCLQCSKCEHGFQRPNELVQHAKRYHPTEQHYSGAPKCPFKCNKKLVRRRHVSDEVLKLLHVFRFHLNLEEAVSYVRNWPEKNVGVMENERLFRFDVLGSLDRSLNDHLCIKCTFCGELIPIEKYWAWHRRPGAACYNENSEFVSSKILAMRSKVLTRTQSTRESSGKTVSQSAAKKRKLRYCGYCSRAVPLSSNYSDEVSNILHVIHAHLQSNLAVKWLRSRDYYKCVQEFPYLDIVATLESSLSSGKSTLHCAVCSFKTDTSARLVRHARLHDELLNNKGNYLDPCVECGEAVPVCSQAKNDFQRLCHVLVKHRENSESVVEAVKLYESSHGENGGMILNVQRSLETQSDDRFKFICSKCEFLCYNGYALIEHYKLHEVEYTDYTKKPVREIRREPPIVCSYCSRVLVCSNRYTPRVTLLAHFVKFHRLSNEDVDDFTGKCESWQISREFPFIDAVLSIKHGKLQCALCEASLPDTAQIMKHATIVHEGHRPNLEEGLSSNCSSMPKESPSVSNRLKSSKEERKFNNVCEKQVAISQVLLCQSDPLNQPGSANNPIGPVPGGREDNPLYASNTSEKERSVKIQQESQSTAPTNDHIPKLPSSAREVDRTSYVDQLAQQTDNVNEVEGIGSPQVAMHVHNSEDDVPRGNTSRKSVELAEEASQNTPLSADATARSSPSNEIAITSGPTTSTPKQQKPYQAAAVKSSILSWLSPITRSVLPQRPAELAINESQSLRNLRSALNDSFTTLNESATEKTSAHVSVEGTLFDELPQRMVRRMGAQAKPPEDISHIEGAKGFPCNFCTFKALTVGDIRRHTSMAHSEVLPSLSSCIISPCHLCNNTFRKRSLLLKHITDHHMDVQDPFKCAYCPKQYATARTMREHERRIHESRLFLDAANMVCPYCDKEFGNKRNRDEHIRRHRSLNSSTSRGF